MVLPTSTSTSTSPSSTSPSIPPASATTPSPSHHTPIKPTSGVGSHNPPSPSIHYLDSGIPIPVPPSGMVETYEHGDVFADECASPPGGVNGVDTGASYPPSNSNSNGDAEEGQGGGLLGVARVWEDRIERFLAREGTAGGDGGGLLRDVQRQTRISLGVVEEALRRWRFEELAMSFNGGKDCLVMLIIFLAGVSRWHRSRSTPSRSTHPTTPPLSKPPSSTTTTTTTTTTPSTLPPPPTTIPCVYVMSTHPFPEVDHFVSTCVPAYHLTVHRYPTPMKSAFATYLSLHPRVRAIFVGTRRTDPHGAQLGHFDPTDQGWPPFVRCQPVIDWRYREIWSFLRELNVPYCALYDLGYTSLGGTTDTHPNPELAVRGGGDGDGDGKGVVVGYRPAYELVEDEQERLGRDR